MIRSKAAIFAVLGLLVVMTGVFTATGADLDDSGAAATGQSEFILVNADGIPEEQFTSRVATVEQNMMMLTAQAEAAGSQGENEFVDSFLEIMDRTPAESIALASLILDTAIYQEAVSQGHQPDIAMIQEQVEQERMVFEAMEEDPEQYGVNPSQVEAYRAEIDAIGEEQYWNEHYPRILELQAANRQFAAAIEEEGGDWIDVQQDVFHRADVQLREPEAVAPGTVDGAEEYMDSVWALTLEEEETS